MQKGEGEGMKQDMQGCCFVLSLCVIIGRIGRPEKPDGPFCSFAFREVAVCGHIGNPEKMDYRLR